MFRKLLSVGLVCCAALVPPSTSCAQDEETQDQTPLESPFLEEPKTPAGLLQAARISTQLARPTLARQYLQQLLDAADDATLLQLREQFGPAEFLRLGTNRQLHPESRTLLERTNAAFRTSNEDPNRVADLIASLQGSASQRRVALESLRAGGPAIVSPMLAVLADDARSELHNTVTVALSQLTRTAAPAVLAGIDSDNERVRTSSLLAVGYLGDRSVVPYLWHPAFAPGVPAGVRGAARSSLQRLLANAPNRPQQISNYGASDELYVAAEAHFRGTYNWDANNDGTVTRWTWADGGASSANLTTEEASLRTGMRLARDAMELAPADRDKQALYLAFALAADSQATGWQQPLPVGSGTAMDLALSVGGDLLAKALDMALAANNVNAARGALTAIWQVGSDNLLGPANGQQSVLRRALSHSDQRIQFASANAMLNLAAGRQFAGSGQVLAVLRRALGSDSVVSCLIIDPNAGRGGAMASLLGDLGFKTRTTTTGRAGFSIAAAQGDVALIAVNANTVQWALSETIANLRADSRTSGIPVVIYGPAYAEAQIQPMLERYSQLTFIEETDQGDDGSRKMVALSLKPFLEARLYQETPEELASRKSLAAAWFARLAGPNRSCELDLSVAQPELVTSVRDPEIAGPCLQGLGAIPTASAQLELHKLSVDDTLAETSRAAAMNELVYHIQRNSLMLGADQQVALLQMAEALAGTPLSTPAAALIGAMQPDARRTFERLKRFSK